MILSNFAIRRPVTTTMFFVALGILGVISLDRLPVQLLPEVVYPEVYVSLTLQGASPEQVEQDLVMPTEGEVGKMSGVQEIASSARSNRGNVQVSFAPGTDMKFALLQVQSRMARLLPLFPERTRVTVQRFDSSDLSATIMELQVLSGGDLNWLRDFAEEKIRPELEAVDGVVSATVMGGQQSAVEVIVDTLQLQAHGLSINQINTSVNRFNLLRAYLGKVYDGAQAYAVSAQGQFSDLRQVLETVIKPEIPLRLGDLAQVRYGLQRRTDLNRINGKASVGVRIQKEDEANLIAVSRDVEAMVARLNRDLASQGVELIVSNSQAELMEEALSTLKQAAGVGIILGLCVLFLFLRNLRFVVVLLLAIPTSLLMTFNLMYAWDLSLNVLSLCGLALAVGMLADNAIVVMESIFKHFERGKSPVQAARDGTAEVGRAVVAATATTVAVFLPVAFIQTDYQDILRELALSIAFPLLASLLVALTLIPALAVRTLSRTARPPLATGRLMEMYTLLLKAGLRHRVRVSVGIAAALLATLVASFFLMLQQQVVEEETQFTVYISLPEGATLDATDGAARQVEASVQEIEGLKRFTTSVRDDGQASVTVMLLKRSERPGGMSVAEIKEDLEEGFGEISGAVIGYESMGMAGGGGGGRARGGGGRGGGGGARRQTGGFNLQSGAPSEEAVIRGYDFATLQMIADDLVYRLEEIEEIDANSVRSDVQRSSPEIQIIPDAQAMFDRGLQTNTVLSAISDAQPEGVSPRLSFLMPDGTEIPIQIRMTEDVEAEGPDMDGLRQIPIPTGAGAYIPVGEVAYVRTDEGRSIIQRTGQSRRAVVSYRFTSEILDSQPRLDAARDLVQTVVQDMILPEGYTVEIVEAEVETIYYWMMGIAAVLIYMILASLFESFTSPVIIFCTLPTAVIGSCWALIMSETGLTSQAGPMALLGFIVLIGIAVNNGIILIDAIATLRTQHGHRRERAVLAAGRSRVRPILMTSATTLLGVLPLALEFGGDYEIWPPFAITVLGGLSVSMLSTLVFVPVAYMGLDRAVAWLKDIGRGGVALATLAAAAATYGVHARYESIFWTALVALPFWSAFLGLIWAGLRVHRARAEARRISGQVLSIQLRNLTKIYGAPGRFRREWARFDRRTGRLRAAGLDPTDRKAIRDGLSWKLPLLLLMAFLHAYFKEALWIYLLALGTWGLTSDLKRSFALLWSPRLRMPKWLAVPLRGMLRHGLPVLFLSYVHWRLRLPSITVASASAWLGVLLIRALSDRVRDGRVDLEAVAGRLSWLKRWAYRGAAAVPLIGVPKPEFLALGGVDLEIGRGMFGLLGPNGAGKTTLMRIVCRVLEPSFGSVVVSGKNLTQGGSIHGLIGYLPQHFGLHNHLTAYQFLDYRALLEGFRDGAARRARVLKCLEQVNLLDRKDDPIGSFSGGMKQRIGIAQTLLHMPQIVVVDEPTAGLDPVERIRFRNLLAQVAQQRIVIFSTHIVEDVSGSCNRLAVLNRGRILYTGTPQSMRDLAQGKVWETVVPNADFAQATRELRLVSHLRTPSGVRVRFLSEAPPRDMSPQPVDPTLEDAYLYLLGQGRETHVDVA